MKPRIKIIDAHLTLCSSGKFSKQDIFSQVIDKLFDYYGNNIKKKRGDADYVNNIESDFFIIGGNWFHKNGGTIMMQEWGDDEFLFAHVKASKRKIKNPNQKQ